LGLNDDEIHEIYVLWNKGELNSYLVEITNHIFSKQDEKSGKRPIDEILDVAEQNGTGMRTSQSAMELQVPTPTIDWAAASEKYKYHLDLEAVARIWRGGCIIPATLLGDICAAFRARCDLPNLLPAANLSRKFMEHQQDLRKVVCVESELRIPASGLMFSSGYFDAHRTFHTEWKRN
jgi:6-phosphogluconate dehydrogenase